MENTLRKLHKDAKSIFMGGVEAVDPYLAVTRHLSLDGDSLRADGQTIDLPAHGRILVVGAGKAGAPMARAVEEILGDRISDGLICVKYGHLSPVDRTRIVEAGHPVPDENGLKAARGVAELLGPAGEDDLVICLISGGGSALLPLPTGSVTLEDKQAVTGLLLRSGAEIGEINAVRKHLSVTKGGGLARLAYPARVLALILSDVVGDPLDVIASGPTVPDPTTFNSAMEILDRYDIRDQVPSSVLRHLEEGVDGKALETLKPGAPEFESVFNLLVGTNAMAVEAAAARARELGYETSVLSSSIIGEARVVATGHAEMAARMRKEAKLPTCLLSGGETTVTIAGDGKGGRNQEFALAAAIGIDGLANVLILSAGTDGSDGPTDAAGAMADGTTVARALSQGLDPVQYLEGNDSYHFFEALGDLLITGPTMTNVMDLHIILVGGGNGD